jgi:hypothetical protein
MRRYLLWLIVGGLLTAVLTAACDDGGGGQPSPTAAPTGAASPGATPIFIFEGPVGIDLFIFGTFHELGEPISFTITIAAAEPITLHYRTTQRYDIVVTNTEGTEVWRWSKDKAFGEVVEEVSLETNQSITFSESWDQRDNNGQQVPAATYTVTATSSHCDANLENCGQLSASGVIQIRES